MSWTDALGVAHPPAGPEARIVSLVPSITELLFALGLGPQVVGRTGFCIHPHDAITAVPKVGGTKDVKLDAVRALRPSHLIVNIDENEQPTVDALRPFVPHVIVTHPNAPADNFALMRLLGGVFGLFGAAARAEDLCRRLEAEMAACTAAIERRHWRRESVLYLIWRAPWMTVAADTYIARSLALVDWHVRQAAGGWSGAARYPALADAAFEAEVARVDRVLLSTEPFMFRPADVDALRARYPAAQIDLIDGAMASWYGVRAIAGLQYLRALRAGMPV